MEQLQLLDRPSFTPMFSRMRESLLPSTTWTMPNSFPDLTGAKRIGVDIEAKDPELKQMGPGFVRGKAHAIGVAVVTDDGFRGYYPMRHESGGNIAPSKVCAWLKDQMKGRGTKIGANLPYDYEGLFCDGIKLEGPLRDVQIAEALLDEESEEGMSLDALAFKYLGKRKEEEILTAASLAMGLCHKPKNGKPPKPDKALMYLLPAAYVADYAIEDALDALEIDALQQPLLEREQLTAIYELECKLVPIVFEMRRKGVPVDLDKAEQLAVRMLAEEKLQQASINGIAGFPVDVWSPPSMSKAFDGQGLVYPRTEKGNPSFRKKWLEQLTHPFGKQINERRKLEKLRRDFVENLAKYAVNGRIHTKFNQMASDEGGTRSGRFSSSNPNLQQIPSRDAIYGPLIRALFTAEHGALWGKADYSQQEPRLLVHYAYLRKLVGAEKARDMYCDPKADWYRIMAVLADISRDDAKIVHLALTYNMGDPTFAEKLGRPIEDAQQLRAKFNENLPFATELNREVIRMADRRGYIRTMLGRRRHFNFWEPADYQRGAARTVAMTFDKARAEWGHNVRLRRAHTHKALNSLIQGSAADQTKQALLLVSEAGYTPNLQVHDELDFAGLTDKKQGADIKEIMEHCVTMTVPSRADMGFGPTWGELTK